MIPFSILDLCPISRGSTPAQALRNSLDLAREAERLGFRRFWLAEHHNAPAIASAATAVVIGYVAGGTKVIRVGAGGVMLPNHSPLMVAEQFGTLASLFPDRIDLGLGRAPGTTKAALPALRQDFAKRLEEFPLDVQELQAYLAADQPDRAIRAIPGAGLDIPIWMLGSSQGGALLAAKLGLPFAYASHFAPDALQEALQLYRDQFQCCGKLRRPYVMLTVNLYGAESDTAARRHFTSLQQAALSNQRGVAIEVPPPIEAGADTWTDSEKADVMHALTYSFVGDARTIEAGLREFIATTRPDELMLAGFFYEHAARIRSLQIAAAVRYRLGDITASVGETSAGGGS